MKLPLSVIVITRDPATKQAIVGTAQARSAAAQLADDPGSLAGRFGSPVLVVEGGFPSQAEADRAAEALAEQPRAGPQHPDPMGLLRLAEAGGADDRAHAQLRHVRGDLGDG